MKPVEQDSGRLILRLLRLSWKYKLGCLRVLALTILQLLMVLSGLSLLGMGIDVIHAAADPSRTPPAFLFGLGFPPQWTPMQCLFLAGGLILVFGFLKMGISITSTVFTNRLVQGKIVLELRSKVFQKLQHLGFGFFDSGATGSIINRVTGDVQAVRSFVDGIMLPLVTIFISLGFYLYYMMNIHVGLTLACLATTPLLWIMTLRFSNRVRPAYQQNRELVDKMVLRLAETIQGIAVVKCFGREGDEFSRFEAAAENVRSQQLGIFERVSRFVPSVGFLTHFNVFVLLLYGGWLVMQGEIPLGTGLVVFASLLGNFSNQVNEMAQITNTMQQCLAGARRVFEVLDRPVEVSNSPDARRMEKARGEITFENVSFSFREGSSTLRELSFHVEPGSLIAILGATGSGKTALLSLIPRFYDPAEGRVLLDGIDLRSLELQSLRRQVGVVFQESFLFSTTIAGNIAFGSPEASRAEIEKAARLACAHEFIEQLPEGYDTLLSEGGSNLSGGQKQRLSIARALLLEPAVLLLDDPTSAIDPDTEHEILNAMESAMRGRTTFVVAHRLSTLKRADRILVLEKGRLIQSGNHSQLMQEKSLYRHAVRSQLSGEDILDPRPEALL